MMTPILAALCGAIGVALGALITGMFQRTAIREQAQTQGLAQVKAADVAAKAMEIDGVRDLVKDLLQETGNLRQELRDLGKEVAECHEQHRKCEEKSEAQDREIRGLREEVARLREEVKKKADAPPAGQAFIAAPLAAEQRAACQANPVNRAKRPGFLQP